MSVHGPSVALGFSAAIILVFAAKRMRPVAVELGAVTMELLKVGRAIIESQRENLEDFFCEVQTETEEQSRRRREERMKYNGVTNPSPKGAS